MREIKGPVLNLSRDENESEAEALKRLGISQDELDNAGFIIWNVYVEADNSRFNRSRLVYSA